MEAMRQQAKATVSKESAAATNLLKQQLKDVSEEFDKKMQQVAEEHEKSAAKVSGTFSDQLRKATEQVQSSTKPFVDEMQKFSEELAGLKGIKKEVGSLTETTSPNTKLLSGLGFSVRPLSTEMDRSGFVILNPKP